MDPITIALLVSAGVSIVGGLISGAQEADKIGKANKIVAQSNLAREKDVAAWEVAAKAGGEAQKAYINKLLNDFATDPLYTAVEMPSYDTIVGQSALAKEMGATSPAEAVVANAANIVYKDAIAKGYTAKEAEAFAFKATTAAAGTVGAEADRTVLVDTAMKALANQNELSNVLRDQALGKVPSIAEQQMALGMERAAQQQAGLAAQQRGGLGSLLGQRNAAQMGGLSMQQTTRDSGIAAMEEVARNQELYRDMLGGLRTDATNRDTTQGNMDNATALANLRHRELAGQLAQENNQFNARQLQDADSTNTTNRTTVSMNNARAINDARSFGANAANVTSLANSKGKYDASRDRANLLGDALTNETNNKMLLAKQNLMNQQNALDNNASFRGKLVGEDITAGKQVNNAEMDALTLKLGQNPQQQQAAPNWGLDVANRVANGAENAANAYLMMQINKQDNNNNNNGGK